MPKHSPSMDLGPSPQQFDPAFSHDALPPGTQLGVFQIVETIGRGGFGIVYLALDTSLQRQVAIKEYLPAETAMRCEDNQVWVRPGADTAAYAAGKTAFLNEAKLLARFDHPALARVLTFWEDNRTAYMVMPYYDGSTLAEVLAGMPQPPDETWLRGVLSPLLSALQVLHTAQCLHLDISPDNIIVQRDGRPVLLDFGVATRLTSDKTLPLTALLNPAYAPIEQYSESATLPQGPWTDLYALASVLHFAIAGRPPARATVRAVDDPQRPLAETVKALRERHPNLQYSDAFLAAIDKALAVRPRDRPRNVLEFEQLLGRKPVDLTAAAGTAGPRFAAPSSPAPGAAAWPPAPPAAAPTAPSATPPSAAPPAEPSPEAFTPPPFAAPPFAAPPFAPHVEPLIAGVSGGRSEPLFDTAPRESWFGADTPPVLPKRKRSHAPLWIATVCVLALGGVGGWAWLQRQPAQARIGVADLPQSVVAAIPKARPADPDAAPNAAPASAPVAAAASAVPVTPAPQAEVAASAPPPVAASAPSVAPAATTSRESVAAAPPASAPTPSPTSAGPPAPSAMTTAAAAPAPAPAPTPRAEPSAPAKKVAKPATVAAAPASVAPAPAEPNNPRAICGTRTNFALYYCMQTQCKRPKFAAHAQCLDLKSRDEL